MTVIARSPSHPSSLAPALVALFTALLAACGPGGGRANVTPGTLPAGATFTGVYQSPQYGEMQILQTGAQAIGEYTQDERRGRIQGTIQGDLMRFEWSERRELVVGRPTTMRGRGYFRFVHGDDGSDYLVGEWGHDDNEVGGGPWRAVRLRNRRPTLTASSASSGGTRTPSAGAEEEGDDLDGPGASSSPRGGSGRGGDDLGDL